MTEPENKKILKKYLFLSIFCFFISSFSFLFILISDFDGTKTERFFAYAVGGGFWSGLLTGLVLMFILGYKRKKVKFKKYKFPGILCFFGNKEAKICDIIILPSIILMIVFQRIFGVYHWLSIIFLSITLFSIYLHSVFNGNNYAYITQKGAKK